ncbi:hypothetical protein GCM10023215_09740 [Pseudonocardia yuanmonensis]|uniref:Uncharacterized protein n=1 Tax=Pseudonocardia yuanmonensis TaxID=1095914 RepID=A0ABP8W3G0_9PSEU
MDDAFGSRDPRLAADRRDEAAADRDQIAEHRDEFSRLRDSAAADRDDRAQARDTDANPHPGQLLAHLRTLAERLTPRPGGDDASTRPGDDTGPREQHAPGAVLLPREEANAAAQLLLDTITLLESNHALRAQAARDRQDSARDRSAAAQDRSSAAHDRDDSSADRQQAALDREQVDYRTDFQTLQQQLVATLERTWEAGSLVHQTLRSSRERITETKQILMHLHARDHAPCRARDRVPR